ncbi:unnamed protein product [Durusdinium trenchii]|uniref:HTH La-type RNA-binding domain-containing protein n=1 Tax=Durusdinium trenchii TaxID=1381693 RepID=A0ABP0S831_9DINO
MKAASVEYCRSRVDPDDQGDLAPVGTRGDLTGRSVEVMDADGWVPLTELLSLDDFVDFAAADVREVVKESYSKDQPRFECREQGGRLEIRALHKRAAVRFSKGNRMEWRKRASSPEPPLVESPFEEAIPVPAKRNKMRGAVASATEHFDISEECTKDDPGDLPDGLSSSHVEWVRFELSEGVFAWWCTRDDGSEDGFVEMNPEPWSLVTPTQVQELERPCWINGEDGEYFFISPQDTPDESEHR